MRRQAWRSRRENPAFTAEPNAGHRAVVELARQGKLHAVVTQNVDGLHQRAGLAEELMVGGRPAFQVLAEAVSREGGRPRATMVLQDDPHGVMYFVASWLLDEAGASS